jgi:hypothetical protein
MTMASRNKGRDKSSGRGSDSSMDEASVDTETDEELEEVQCENECNAGFKVLIGQTIIVLVCLKCRLEYELSQEMRDRHDAVD